MRRSKREMYIDILRVLAYRGPMRITLIMYETNLNCNMLKKYLNFLIEQNLVEDENSGKRKSMFTITEKGISILKYFKELEQALPIVEETRMA
jgi:predicted transcriptional regulator